MEPHRPHKHKQSEGLTVLSSTVEAHLTGLTDKQRAFARAYAETGNATQSAIIAGYGDKSASVTGSRLSKDPRIRAAIERIRLEASADFDITDETVLKGLLEEATWKGKGSSHAARVSAWARLTEIKGMSKTPDLGAWGGVTTLRIQVALADGQVREIELKKAD